LISVGIATIQDCPLPTPYTPLLYPFDVLPAPRPRQYDHHLHAGRDAETEDQFDFRKLGQAGNGEQQTVHELAGHLQQVRQHHRHRECNQRPQYFPFHKLMLLDAVSSFPLIVLLLLQHIQK